MGAAEEPPDCPVGAEGCEVEEVAVKEPGSVVGVR